MEKGVDDLDVWFYNLCVEIPEKTQVQTSHSLHGRLDDQQGRLSRWIRGQPR